MGWAGKGARWRLWVATGVAVAIAGLAVLVLHEQSALEPPRVDTALERSVLPVVDHYVLADPQGPLGGDEPAGKNRATPRGFCTERVIEIRPAGTALRVGLVAWCSHFVRNGTKVAELDSGVMAGVLTVSPASAPARVTDVSWEPDDVLSTWAPVHFSSGGATEVERILGDSTANLTDPEGKARAAFGLPAPSTS